MIVFGIIIVCMNTKRSFKSRVFFGGERLRPDG